jgi:acyl dehydratase
VSEAPAAPAAAATERVSRWFSIDQDRIDAFAAVCEDEQFIHVDPERAAGTRFGGTIAHGFLTLSMLSAMAYDAMPLRGQLSVNYGFDRIRFLAPVPAGSRVRARFALAGSEERRPGETTCQWDVTVEIEGGGDRPALMARWITRRYEGAA